MSIFNAFIAAAKAKLSNASILKTPKKAGVIFSQNLVQNKYSTLKSGVVLIEF